MTPIVSFSITAVARLGVPPGKWFCLARTGLGYGQYSCCVCGAHHDAFSRNWRKLAHVTDWKARLAETVDATLREMDYFVPSSESPDRTEDVRLMKERIDRLVFTKDNYIVNPWFAKAVADPALRPTLRLITDGPRCLAEMLFPHLAEDQIITGKSKLPVSSLATMSQAHVGTNASDLRIPQTVALINRKLDANDFPSIQVAPRLTPDLIDSIYKKLI